MYKNFCFMVMVTSWIRSYYKMYCRFNQKYPQSKIISTHFKDQDIEFGMPVDEYCERDFKYVLKDKNSEEKGLYDPIYRSTLDKIEKDSVCLSVGGIIIVIITGIDGSLFMKKLWK